MELRCSCGRSVSYGSHYVTCLECRLTCCPSCTFIFESATYCVACAESILGVTGIPVSGHAIGTDGAKSRAAIVNG